MQCSSEEAEIGCPEPPPVEFDTEPLTRTILFLILDAIGLHGLVGIVASVFIILGFIKLAFGRIIFCRETKAQAYAKEMKRKGIKPDGSLSEPPRGG